MRNPLLFCCSNSLESLDFEWKTFKISFGTKKILNNNFLENFIDGNSTTRLSASTLSAKQILQNKNRVANQILHFWNRNSALYCTFNFLLENVTYCAFGARLAHGLTHSLQNYINLHKKTYNLFQKKRL